MDEDRDEARASSGSGHTPEVETFRRLVRMIRHEDDDPEPVANGLVDMAQGPRNDLPRGTLTRPAASPGRTWTGRYSSVGPVEVAALLQEHADPRFLRHGVTVAGWWGDALTAAEMILIAERWIQRISVFSLPQARPAEELAAASNLVRELVWAVGMIGGTNVVEFLVRTVLGTNRGQHSAHDVFSQQAAHELLRLVLASRPSTERSSQRVPRASFAAEQVARRVRLGLRTALAPNAHSRGGWFDASVLSRLEDMDINFVLRALTGAADHVAISHGDTYTRDDVRNAWAGAICLYEAEILDTAFALAPDQVDVVERDCLTSLRESRPAFDAMRARNAAQPHGRMPE